LHDNSVAVNGWDYSGVKNHGKDAN
jgi:hypothetical protein